MRIDNNGYVCINGASDSEDSSMFVGMLATFGFPIQTDFNKYINSSGKYQRCLNPKYDFSRDQFVPFIAGLKAQGLTHLVNQDRVTGKDLMPPSVKGHERRCKGLDSNWFQDAWLMADVYVHAWITPLGEPNQLISMMMVADPKFLRAWCKLNKQWRDSILNYWCLNDGAWRGERELAYKMISVIEEKIK